MYGAVGDGTTDDTTAIQNMLNANYNKCVIVFPKGNYRVTATLVIPTNANRVLYFFDEGTIVCDHNNDGISYQQSDSELGHCKFVNLKVRGPNPEFGAMSAKTSTGAGIRLASAYHNVFDNAYISGFRYGIVINTGIANTFTNDTYVRFNEYGIYMFGDATNDNRFIGCSIRQNWKVGITIDGTNTTAQPMHNVFDDCLIESNIPHVVDDYGDDNGIAVYLKHTASNIFSNCYFENHRRSVLLDAYVISNKFMVNRYVNNKGALFEFAGENTIRNVFMYNAHDSYTTIDSIVISTNYASLPFNCFDSCYGLVLGNITAYSNFPTLKNCVQNASFQGGIFDKLNIGTLYQNPRITETSVSPHIYNGTLYTMGRGYIQFGTLITEDTEITDIDGLKLGDILVLENYQTSHSIQFTHGTLKLNSGKNVTLKANNDTLVLYCNYLGQVVELTRNITNLKPVSLSKTSAVSSHGSNAYQAGNIIQISIDVTMASSSATWVDILTIPNYNMIFGGYFTVRSNSDVVYGQVYNNNGIATVRLGNCSAAQYRGECIMIVE